MQSTDQHNVVLVTAPDPDTGTRLARGVVEAKLAACVNVVPRIESYYWWEDKVQSDAELLLLIKTESSKLTALETYIHEQHPYQVPEFIQLPIQGGSEDYLKWISDSVNAG